VREPRDLTDLVPNEVRAELTVAVAVLEQHGPAVTEALRQLDQATTVARKALDPVPADPGRVAACRARDRHRPWLGCGLPAGVDT
jgi:hypothetical protein